MSKVEIRQRKSPAAPPPSESWMLRVQRWAMKPKEVTAVQVGENTYGESTLTVTTRFKSEKGKALQFIISITQRRPPMYALRQQIADGVTECEAMDGKSERELREAIYARVQ